jgi:hypothetical protein
VEAADLIAVRTYLTPSPFSAWNWDDEGQAIETAAGWTIAFRTELAHVLSRLATHGLPPMEPVVLLLAACRWTWPELSRELTASAGAMASLAREHLPPWLGQMYQGLDDVHGLPSHLREPLEAKTVLAELIFEGCPQRTSPRLASLVVEALQDIPLPGLCLLATAQPDSMHSLMKEYRILHDGLSRVDSDVLAWRSQTGLDRKVEPAEVELPPAERIRQLIAGLVDHPELDGVARMARQLMAAVHLPRAVSDPEDLPLGGVSDIANRGQLDRLLLSELAHDDLTLAVRLALNEALYLRRESPPRTPPRHRAVLIDAGIRLWGVPRVFSTAAAMAFTATSARQITVDAYCAHGAAVTPVDLTRRAGLMAHLGTLEPHAHPGLAMPAFQAAVREREDVADAVVVTGEDVAADPQFRQALAAMDIPCLYLATVSREGRFRMTLQGARGSKAVCEARLDLESLLAPPRRPAPALVNRNAQEDLPAILRCRPFPLRMPHDQRATDSLWPAAGHGVLTLTRDRRLLLWRGPGGGLQLADDLPPGMILWCQIAQPPSEFHAVIGRLQQRVLSVVAVDLEELHCRTVRLRLDSHQPVSVAGHGHRVFVIYDRWADVFDVVDGRKLQTIPLPRIDLRSGRFYCSYGKWYALCQSDVGGAVQHVTGQPTNTLAAMFDSPAYEGPLGISWSGELCSATGQYVRRLGHVFRDQVRSVCVSRDGTRVSITAGFGPNTTCQFHISTGSSEVIYGKPEQYVDQHLWKGVTFWSLRRKFRGVLVDEGRLTLVSDKGLSLPLELRQNRIVFRGEPRVVPSATPFVDIPGPAGVGYTLRAAEWDDGSRAVLDSRGLLHLQSGDRSLPELTLVLHEGEVSGWCSDGRMWGNKFFLGDHLAVPPAEIYRDVLDPFVRRLT